MGQVKWEQPGKVAARVPAMLKEIRAESGRLTDTNAKSEKVKEVLLIGLTQKDYDNLQILAARNPRIKNYGVLVRKVLKEAAR